MKYLPDAPEDADAHFEIRTDVDAEAGLKATYTAYLAGGGTIQHHTLFDHDDDEDTARKRAVTLCGLMRRPMWVVRVSHFEVAPGEYESEEERIADLYFCEDENIVKDENDE